MSNSFSDDFTEISVSGDGNCFFYSVLLGLQKLYPGFVFQNKRIFKYDNQTFIDTLRTTIDDKIISNINQNLGIKGVPDLQRNIIDSITKTECYADEPTVMYLAKLLNIQINVWQNIRGKIQIIQSYNSPCSICVDIIYNGSNHYNAYILSDLISTSYSSPSIFPSTFTKRPRAASYDFDVKIIDGPSDPSNPIDITSSKPLKSIEPTQSFESLEPLELPSDPIPILNRTQKITLGELLTKIANNIDVEKSINDSINLLDLSDIQSDINKLPIQQRIEIISQFIIDKLSQQKKYFQK